jgi:adenine-specific DNA-methyltransferase
VHIDYREFAHLKLLLDEIFGKNNLLTLITLKAKAGAGVGQESFLFDICEYILTYAKNISLVTNEIPFIKAPISDNVTGVYNKILVSFGNDKMIKTIKGGTVGEIEVYIHKDYEIKSLSSLERKLKNYYDNFDSIFRTTNPQGGLMKRVMPQLPKEGLVSFEYTPSKGRRAGQRYRYYFLEGSLIVWLKDTAIKDTKQRQVVKLVKNTNLWIENLHQGIANEGNVRLKQSKKPEKLVKKIIELCSKKSDWILDFFAGSGTTGAVAHKMGRKWIMIEIREGMVKEKALKRMKNVINGDPTGISKDVGWEGGGGFKFYKLGEPLIVKHKDYHSIKIINPRYYNNALIKVICNLE